MKPRLLIIAAVGIAIAVAGLMLFRQVTALTDTSTALSRLIAPALARSGIDDRDLVRESRAEVRRGWGRYVRVSRDYEAKGADLKRLAGALEEALRGTAFSISSSGYSLKKDVEEASVVIARRGAAVMSLVLRQRRAVPKAPEAKKAFPRPKVVIVLDDFGNNMRNVRSVLTIGVPVTFSVLPNLKYSSAIAGLARARGYEVILHLPLEPQRKKVKEEELAINSGLSEREVLDRLEKDIASVGSIAGVSNHMGSKSTEEPALMACILARLREKGLFFLDSFVTPKSVCAEVARKVGVRYARRDVFLDNVLDEQSVKEQLARLKEHAFRTGTAIGIGHDRKVTVKVLGEVLPSMAKEGIRFVKVADLVE